MLKKTQSKIKGLCKVPLNWLMMHQVKSTVGEKAGAVLPITTFSILLIKKKQGYC